MIARLQAIADRNIRRFGLLADADQGAELPGSATDAAEPSDRPARPSEDESNLMRLLAETHHGAQ